VGKKPKLVNRVPEETPKPEVKKPSDLVMKVLRFLCITELIGKWEVLKDLNVTWDEAKFKVEQSMRPSKVEFYFVGTNGKLGNPVNARDMLMMYEAKKPAEFIKLAEELLNKEKHMIESVEYKKGDYDRVCRVRAALGAPEKKYLDTKMTPTEQAVFLRKHELWNNPS